MMEYVEKEVTVGELKDLYRKGIIDIEIDTPDGWQYITNWFNKGPLQLYRITTSSGLVTECAHNHLLEIAKGEVFTSPINWIGIVGHEWTPASTLKIGNCVKTINGDADVIINIEKIDIRECYDFTVDHNKHRYWGDGFSSHNSGKSFICSGNIVREAQQQGIFVVLIDSESALDKAWLEALGVDTSEEKLLKVNMAMIEDVAKLINDFMKDYKASNANIDPAERQKILFVIDSLGMLLTPTDIAQFEAGELKGDMGRKPKQLKALVTNCVNMFGEWEVGLVCTNHTYASQNMFDPDDVISGGSGPIFAASIVVAMQKLKLKEDEDENKVTDVRGIRAKCKVVKTRFSKPFEEVEIKIPWDSGMNPYSGLVDMFEKSNLLVKDGNRLKYVDLQGNETKLYRKEYNRNDENILDKIMLEYDLQMNKQDTINREEVTE